MTLTPHTILILALSLAVPFISSAQSPDEAAISKLIAGQADAWNAGDAHAYAVSFAGDGAFVNVRGSAWHGKADFEKRHAEIFAGFFQGSHQTLHIDRLTLLSPESAYAEISTEVSGYKGVPPGIPPPPDGVMRTRLLEVLKKTNGTWLVEAYYNINVLPSSPAAGK